MFCSEAILTNQDHDEGHAVTLRCKRWSCDLCKPFNHRLTKRRAREGAPNVFLTLTVNPRRYETFDAAARSLKVAWVNLRRAMERDHDVRRPPFIAIFEETKAGWPHLHILMRCKWIDQRWYSATMDRLIGAPIVDVRFIQDVGRVAAYVAKYISKAPCAFKGCKRWWRSHDFEISREERESFKRYSPFVTQLETTLDKHRLQLIRTGWKITGESRDFMEFRRWWLEEPPPRTSAGAQRYAFASGKEGGSLSRAAH